MEETVAKQQEAGGCRAGENRPVSLGLRVVLLSSGGVVVVATAIFFRELDGCLDDSRESRQSFFLAVVLDEALSFRLPLSVCLYPSASRSDLPEVPSNKGRGSRLKRQRVSNKSSPTRSVYPSEHKCLFSLLLLARWASGNVCCACYFLHGAFRVFVGVEFVCVCVCVCKGTCVCLWVCGVFVCVCIILIRSVNWPIYVNSAALVKIKMTPNF